MAATGHLYSSDWRKLGKGSFADVYCAKEVATGRLCALKLDTVTKGNRQKLGQYEVRVLRQIYRSMSIRGGAGACGIPPVLWAGHVKKDLFGYIMPRYGPTADDLAKSHPLSERETATIVTSVLGALKAIHSSGIVHRDIKPQNIMISNGGSKVVLGDFGLAKTFMRNGKFIDPRPSSQLQYRDQITGTVRYCSENQHVWQFHTMRDDVISLFYTASRLMSGRLPWQKSNISKRRVGMIKLKTEPDALFPSLGPYKRALLHARGLKFEEPPDYDGMISAIESGTGM